MYSAFVYEGFDSSISYINYIVAKPDRTKSRASEVRADSQLTRLCSYKVQSTENRRMMPPSSGLLNPVMKAVSKPVPIASV